MREQFHSRHRCNCTQPSHRYSYRWPVAEVYANGDGFIEHVGKLERESAERRYVRERKLYGSGFDHVGADGQHYGDEQRGFVEIRDSDSYAAAADKTSDHGHGGPDGGHRCTVAAA